MLHRIHNSKLISPLPQSVTTICYHNPLPQSVTTIRFHNPFPQSVSTIRFHNPFPQSVTTIRFHNPFPQSVTTIRYHNPLPQFVTTFHYRTLMCTCPLFYFRCYSPCCLYRTEPAVLGVLSVDVTFGFPYNVRRKFTSYITCTTSAVHYRENKNISFVLTQEYI
jgi:hypothetical protein